MLSDLPVEMLEMVLMRAFLMSYVSHFDYDDERKSKSSECHAFRVLSLVCSDWHLTLHGWPQSRNPHWVRHQLKKKIERE